MLQEIHISNFVLIDELEIEFFEGLNVLTGETGAGKSIIIDAISLIMGDRIKNDFIRNSNRKAIVEAVFDIGDDRDLHRFLLDNAWIDEEEKQVVISREMTASGRNYARINGRSVSASALKSLTGNLIDMHLQHDSLSILRPERYLYYVDSFAPGNNAVLERIARVYEDLKEYRAKLAKHRADEQIKLQKLDFLNFQVTEIEKAKLHTGEEEELLVLRTRIKNAQLLADNTERLVKLLYNSEIGNSAYDQLASAIDITTRLRDDDFYASLTERLEEMYYALQEIGTELSSFQDTLDFEPGLLEEVEERLYTINRLKSKYGNSIDEVLAFLKRSRTERDELEHGNEKEEQLEQQITSLNMEYQQLAAQLSRSRKIAAHSLEEMVLAELRQLNMPQLRFAVEVEEGGPPGIYGWDRIEFLFSANPGEEMRPLHRIASGGELSRFVLGLKKVLAQAYQVSTLIFDEIDVGVGGAALTSMARKINELALSRQVILVTHSPQVASYADTHYAIKKVVDNEHTFIVAELLDTAEKIHEIARMLSGDNYSDLTVQHAREMLHKS